MYIGYAIFTAGQTYVGLTRVISLGGLHLINVNYGRFKAQEFSICQYSLNSQMNDWCAIKKHLYKFAPVNLL